MVGPQISNTSPFSIIPNQSCLQCNIFFWDCIYIVFEFILFLYLYFHYNLRLRAKKGQPLAELPSLVQLAPWWSTFNFVLLNSDTSFPFLFVFPSPSNVIEFELLLGATNWCLGRSCERAALWYLWKDLFEVIFLTDISRPIE